jgi:hypothetical protein
MVHTREQDDLSSSSVVGRAGPHVTGEGSWKNDDVAHAELIVSQKLLGATTTFVAIISSK